MTKKIKAWAVVDKRGNIKKDVMAVEGCSHCEPAGYVYAIFHDKDDANMFKIEYLDEKIVQVNLSVTYSIPKKK